MRKTPSILFIIAFLANTLGPFPLAQAQELALPAPGSMVQLSRPFTPPILKGMKIHPDNPFHFDFILDKGDSNTPQQLEPEANRLIKYFLASLTIPEKDLWVNLSPYEKDRIIPHRFGLTEMGRDLLAEDYMLKQITASLIYPEGETGKKFWGRVYEKAAKKFGTTNVAVNTFNKVWIVPEKAVVYENTKAGTAYVVEAKLKVMLEEDYLSMQKHGYVGVAEGGASPASAGFGEHAGETRGQDPNINHLGSQIVREIVIPELTKEVNEGRNFAQLRQVYNSLILAAWYKKKIKDSILEVVYADKNKISGLSFSKNSIGDPGQIYQRYLQAFKKGVFNYIKEEPGPMTQAAVPRKYFSGGLTMDGKAMDAAMTVVTQMPALGRHGDLAMVSVNIKRIIELFKSDQAQLAVQHRTTQEGTAVLKERLLQKAPILGKLSDQELQGLIDFVHGESVLMNEAWQRIKNYHDILGGFDTLERNVTHEEQSRNWAIYLSKGKISKGPQIVSSYMVFEFIDHPFPRIDWNDPKPGEVYSDPHAEPVVWRYIDLTKFRPSRVLVEGSPSEIQMVKKVLEGGEMGIPVVPLENAQIRPDAFYHSRVLNSLQNIVETRALNSREEIHFEIQALLKSVFRRDNLGDILHADLIQVGDAFKDMEVSLTAPQMAPLSDDRAMGSSVPSPLINELPMDQALDLVSQWGDRKIVWSAVTHRFPGEHVYGAWRNGEFAGLMVAHQGSILLPGSQRIVRSLVIDGLETRDDQQGLGIGRALVTEAARLSLSDERGSQGRVTLELARLRDGGFDQGNLDFYSHLHFYKEVYHPEGEGDESEDICYMHLTKNGALLLLGEKRASEDQAMSAFKPYDAINEAYNKNENIFRKGWWVEFDMDKAHRIESSFKKPAFGILDQIILEIFSNIKGVGFFSTNNYYSNDYYKEEGFIYIPSEISRDELSGRLKAIHDLIQIETRNTIRSRETVTFAVLKGEDLAAYEAGHVTEGISPGKDMTAMENLLTSLLRSGKGVKEGPRNHNYGNKSVFYNPNGGIDFTADKTPLEIQNAGEGINFHLDPTMLEELRNAPGFVPVIISVKPLIDLQRFLCELSTK